MLWKRQPNGSAHDLKRRNKKDVRNCVHFTFCRSGGTEAGLLWRKKKHLDENCFIRVLLYLKKITEKRFRRDTNSFGSPCTAQWDAPSALQSQSGWKKNRGCKMHHYLSLSDNLTTGKLQMFQSKTEAKRNRRVRLAKSHFALSARTPSSCRQLSPLKSKQKRLFFQGFLKNATSRCHPELFHACCLFSEQRRMPLPTLPKQDGILPSALWGQGHTERHFEHANIACADFTASGIQLPESL